MYIYIYNITVPQKGYARRGSNRQITKKNMFKSLKSNLFLEPLLAYPFCGTVNHRRRSCLFDDRQPRCLCIRCQDSSDCAVCVVRVAAISGSGAGA